jgi:hypothetical protein
MLCWSAMAAPAALKSPATYEDLRQVPDHLVAEILNGDLYATPRPRPRHAHAASVLGSEILGRFTSGAADRADGGSSSSQSCIWDRTSWYPTWPDGDANA